MGSYKFTRQYSEESDFGRYKLYTQYIIEVTDVKVWIRP